MFLMRRHWSVLLICPLARQRFITRSCSLINEPADCLGFSFSCLNLCLTLEAPPALNVSEMAEESQTTNGKSQPEIIIIIILR